jgi:hypothetical protein
MVRDAYSADGPQPSNEAESSNAQGQPLDINSTSTANLTQELAELLAATIAQGKTGQRAGAPTGSELASLAALVSASQSQRAMSPSFRDGLSSLSYTPPAQRAPQPVQLTEHHHDDEPMPIPSTWRQPVASDDDRWYRQQIGAAALGLVAGLMVVVPAVLWLSGWLGGPQTRAASARQVASTERMPEIKAAEVRPVRVQVRPVEQPEPAAQYVPTTAEPRPVAVVAPPVIEHTPPPAPPAKVEPPAPKPEDILAQAVRRIETGDILGAREVLAASDTVKSGPVTFALAETYDPNMLAAWGARGVSADVVRARSLYFKARDLGVARAQLRLDQLK